MKEKLLNFYKQNISPGPLNGKIVIGFCYYVAGPIALQNLVGQGALVIKIEQKPIGDPSRYVFSPSIFNTLAHGQLSVAIDYKDKSDQTLLRSLLTVADVIVDNRSVRAKENDLFLNAYLENENKSSPVIYCSIDGFPNAKVNRMPGLDASAQACTGLPYTNCFNPDKPLKVGIPVLDITTGLLAANYILANLCLLSQAPLPPSTKQVIRIAVSLAGTSVWLQANQYLDAMEGKEYFRTGNRDRYAAPFSYYTTKNGLISIASVNEDQFKRFCTNVLKNPEFHSRYPNIKYRIENQEAFERDLNELLIKENREHWLEKCKKHDIPAAPVLTISQALEQDFVKKNLITYQDEKPVVTHGVTNSLFTPVFISAPELNQDGEKIKSLCIPVSKL